MLILNSLRFLLLLFLIVMFSASCSGSENKQISKTEKKDSELKLNESNLKKFEKKLEEYLHKLKIPSCSACIIQNGEIVFKYGFNYFDSDKGKANENTVYHLASLTKTFTSVLVAQLIEQGQLDLNDPCSKYGIQLKPDVKIKHLLSHTSEGTPGTYFSYNSTRYKMLGKICEKVSGKTYAELLNDKILVSLQMNNTTLNPAASEGMEKNAKTNRIVTLLAKPYKIDDSGEPKPNYYPEGASPSAGMLSSISDLTKYAIALDSDILISKKTKDIFFKPFVSEKDTLPYGYGWFVQYVDGIKVVWHYGDWKCNSSLMMKIPDYNITLILLANSDNLSVPFPGLGVPGDVLRSVSRLSFLNVFITAMIILI